jgi:hypothetical protein
MAAQPPACFALKPKKAFAPFLSHPIGLDPS